MKSRLLALLLCAASAAHAQLGPNGATASFLGSLPPKPTADLTPEQQSALEKELTDVTASFQAVKKHARAADADIFLKAVRYALEFHEWYDKKPEDGVKKASALLDEAKKRIESLKKNETPWMNGSGQKVLGFYSEIDGSAQPYGVEVPEGLEWGQGKKPVPMWIWLHGRGDTATDLHFVYSRLMAKKPGQFQPKGTIVIHPFGRYCNGWKSAGETDVFEARNDAMNRFNVDDNRIALAGFSMGGAGAWHLGAHYASQWAVVHTGAGFVDVKRYQKLTPEKMPPWYEQKLWGVYDVPDYAANFHNVLLISYSGEIDAQRDSAEYMTEVLAKEGITRPHLIGPGMPHKYHPETIKEVQKLVEEAVEKGAPHDRTKVSLQFRSGRYNSQAWLNVNAVGELWGDTRVDAEIKGDELLISTKNVRSFTIQRYSNHEPDVTKLKTIVDGQTIDASVFKTKKSKLQVFTREKGTWFLDENYTRVYAANPEAHLKSGGTCIDDVFFSSFIFVLPDGPCESPAVDAWVKTESRHAIQRWRSLMRGDPMVMTASEFLEYARTEHKNQQAALVLWGDAKSNPLIATFLKDGKSPLNWQKDKVTIGGSSFDAATHVPVMCYPNDAIKRLYVQGDDNAGHQKVLVATGMIVINSGLTFREAHDKTNSLQNPKLPDWAILDITQPPTAESAGKVVAADFFDEHWQVNPNMPPVDSK